MLNFCPACESRNIYLTKECIVCRKCNSKTPLKINNIFQTLTGQVPKSNQEEFFFAQHNFLFDSEKKFGIFRGGMGIGKTITTLIACNLYTKDKESPKIYVGIPFSKLKDSWIKELKLLELDFGVWLSKKQCTECWHSNPSDCKAECDHNESIFYFEGKGENKKIVFTDECRLLFKKLIEHSPINAQDFYKKIFASKHFEEDNNLDFLQKQIRYCKHPSLWGVIRYGLLNMDFIVGDYIPTFSGMMDYMVLDGTKGDILLLDEAHKFPDRLKKYHSKSFKIYPTTFLNFEKNFEKMKIIMDSVEMENKARQFIRKLEVWKDKIMLKMENYSKTLKFYEKPEVEYNFYDFAKDFDFNECNKKYADEQKTLEEGGKDEQKNSEV